VKEQLRVRQRMRETMKAKKLMTPEST